VSVVVVPKRKTVSSWRKKFPVFEEATSLPHVTKCFTKKFSQSLGFFASCCTNTLKLILGSEIIGTWLASSPYHHIRTAISFVRLGQCVCNVTAAVKLPDHWWSFPSTFIGP